MHELFYSKYLLPSFFLQKSFLKVVGPSSYSLRDEAQDRSMERVWGTRRNSRPRRKIVSICDRVSGTALGVRAGEWERARRWLGWEQKWRLLGVPVAGDPGCRGKRKGKSRGHMPEGQYHLLIAATPTQGMGQWMKSWLFREVTEKAPLLVTSPTTTSPPLPKPHPLPGYISTEQIDIPQAKEKDIK